MEEAVIVEAHRSKGTTSASDTEDAVGAMVRFGNRFARLLRW